MAPPPIQAPPAPAPAPAQAPPSAPAAPRPWSTAPWRSPTRLRREMSSFREALAVPPPLPMPWVSPLWNAPADPQFRGTKTMPEPEGSKFGVLKNQPLPPFGQGRSVRRVLDPIGHERAGCCAPGVEVGEGGMCGEIENEIQHVGEDVSPKTRSLVPVALPIVSSVQGWRGLPVFPAVANVGAVQDRAKSGMRVQDMVGRKVGTGALAMGVPMVSEVELRRKFEIPDVIGENLYKTLSAFGFHEVSNGNLTAVENHLIQKILFHTHCKSVRADATNASALHDVMGSPETVAQSEGAGHAGEIGEHEVAGSGGKGTA